MNDLCMIIKKTVKLNFMDMRNSIQTYRRESLCCGVPCWRWIYHAIHSADRYFINPSDYKEPAFHREGMDDLNIPCDAVLSDEQLMFFLDRVEQKTYDYLNSLTDDMLNIKPEGCEYTRMDLILKQIRHLAIHIGMINGQTLLESEGFMRGYLKWQNQLIKDQEIK